MSIMLKSTFIFHKIYNFLLRIVYPRWNLRSDIQYYPLNKGTALDRHIFRKISYTKFKKDISDYFVLRIRPSKAFYGEYFFLLTE